MLSPNLQHSLQIIILHLCPPIDSELSLPGLYEDLFLTPSPGSGIQVEQGAEH